jgi:peptidoglycan DL-endopeptidase CwlO
VDTRPRRAVNRCQRKIGLAGLSLTVVLAASTGWGSPAAAEPVPGLAEIERSEQQVRDKAAEVAAIEDKLEKASAVARTLDIEAAQSAEAYNGALLRLTMAQRESDEARRRAADARREVDEANVRKGQLAAASYRMGGVLDGYAALMSADGPVTAMQQAATLNYLGQRTTTILADARTAEALARLADERAGRALAEQQQAADEVRRTKQQAEAALAAQQQRLAGISGTQERLLSELAAARRTTVELERARRRGLAEEAARRAAEARDAEARRLASDGGGWPEGASLGTTTGAGQALAYARAQLGKPYIWAADGPDTFDCSGLTMMAWRTGGVSLPHYSVAQYEQVRHVSRAGLRPGDLIFWSKVPGSPGSIYHVALYIGGDQMIHAPRTGDVVKVSNMYYMGTPDFYGRP